MAQHGTDATRISRKPISSHLTLSPSTEGSGLRLVYASVLKRKFVFFASVRGLHPITPLRLTLRLSRTPTLTPLTTLTIRAGTRARAHLAREGLRARDIAIVPGAAGGPKGLILHALDQFLFGEWLPQAPRRRDFIGASIGAWRMAAAMCPDPAAAFARLAHFYTEQRYGPKPTPREVTEVGFGLMAAIFGGHEAGLLAHAQHRLHLITVHGRGALHGVALLSRNAELRGFAQAALANGLGRSRLAKHLNRVIFSSGMAEDALPEWLFGQSPHDAFDAFNTIRAPLNAQNLTPALIASGTIPLILEAARNLPDAPPGHYWDGGIIDYHLHLPYHRSPDLVLYPHFVDYIVPGWLDKTLPWRKLGHKKRAQGDAWLDNVVLVAPSKQFVASLPNAKLPDRGDFKRYGMDHAGRIAAWRIALAESARLREAFQRFLTHPGEFLVQPL